MSNHSGQTFARMRMDERLNLLRKCRVLDLDHGLIAYISRYKVRIVLEKNGRCIQKHILCFEIDRRVAYSAKSRCLAVWCQDLLVIIDGHSGRHVEIPGASDVDHVSFTADGAGIVVNHSGFNYQDLTYIHDVFSGKILRILPAKLSWFSPDANYAVGFHHEPRDGWEYCAHSKIRYSVWDAKDLRLRYESNLANTDGMPIREFGCSGEGEVIAFYAHSSLLLLCNLKSGEIEWFEDISLDPRAETARPTIPGESWNVQLVIAGNAEVFAYKMAGSIRVFSRSDKSLIGEIHVPGDAYFDLSRDGQELILHRGRFEERRMAIATLAKAVPPLGPANITPSRKLQ